MVGIVDYSMGNLRSVQKAFELLGVSAQIIRTPSDIRRADKLVLPGVGAFADAMAVLESSGQADAIKDFVRTQRPFLGICLGLQLLMQTGYEDGQHAGLGIVPGECVRFTVDQPPQNLKVPHMGWNSVRPQSEVPLFKNVVPGTYFYFVHSYYVRPTDPRHVAATSDYGGEFTAAISMDQVMAVQFHPEKSQAAGRIILTTFAKL
ncbi:MAG: imidazole glycerol phosphate synthase subunit HisH [Phycisphaerae bacterium]